MVKIVIFNRIILFILIIAFRSSFAQNASTIDSLLRIINITPDSLVKIESLIKLSFEIEGSNPDQALIYAQRASFLSEKTGSDILKVRSKIRIGACYIAMNNYETALQVIDEANSFAKTHKLVNETAMTLGNLSIIYGALGNYQKSSEYSFQCLAIYEELKDKKSVGITLGNIGTDFLLMDNHEKAIEYLTKSLNIAEEIRDLPGIAYQNNNIGSVYLEFMNDYTTALSYFYKALSVNIATNNLSQQANNLINIGYSYYLLNQPDSALLNYNSAHTILKEINKPINLANCQLKLALYYLSIEDYTKGFDYANSAFEIGRRQKSVEISLKSAETLQALYHGLNDYENAFRFAVISSQTKDTLHKQQNQRDMLRLEIQYTIDKQERMKQTRQQRRNFIIGLIILCLLSGIVIVTLINSHQKIKIRNTMLEKQSVELELDVKNKRLSGYLMALIKKNEIISQVSEKLIKIEETASNPETKNAIGKMSKELLNQTDNKLLEEFSARFQEVHVGFYDALLHKYPELTQNDMRLCAYLRLNMSTKEISELTGQTIISLENARYRLRKKFGINNSDINLVTFIHQI